MSPARPDDVFKNGVIIQLRIKCWTGSAELEVDDLGMQPEELAEPFELGRKRIVPKAALEPIKQAARRATYALEHMSHALPDGGRFVLLATLPEVAAALAERREAFNTAVHAFLNEYPEWRERMRPHWDEAARVAYRKAGRPGDQAVFIESFLARIGMLYPTRERLEGKFDFAWYCYELRTTGLQEVNAAHLTAEETRRREADEAYRAEVQQRLQEALDHSVAQLYGQIATTFGRVVEHVQSGRPIRDGSIDRLRRAIAQFRKLNIFGESSVEAAIAAFEQTCLQEIDVAAVSATAELRQVFHVGLQRVVDAAIAGVPVNARTGRLARQFDLGGDEEASDEDNAGASADEPDPGGTPEPVAATPA